MKNKLVSIIIPVYNAEKYLSKCLDSVINQSYNNIEIIIVNDGSTDKSINICNKYAKKDNRVYVINKKNTGVSDSRNEGLKVAKGEWISFIDSDDYINIDMIKKMYNKAIATNSDVCICNFYNVIDGKNIINSFNLKGEKTFVDEVLGRAGGFLCNKLYKKDLIGTHRFNEKICMCEDLLFNVSLANINTINYCIIEEPLYYYLKNTNGELRWKKDYTKLSVLKYIIDYYDNMQNTKADEYRLRYLSDYLIARKYNPNEGNEYNRYFYMYMKQISFWKLSTKEKIKYICIKYFKNTYLKRK